ncbi:MAG: RNA polymerase sigma factor [Candidatus Acidiferrales bacterium]
MEFYSFDEGYLQRLRERDFQTEQHFVAYFSQFLQLKLRSRLRSAQTVEDIRQETFVRVLKLLGTEGGIRQPERLGAFVNSICNNVLQEYYRSTARLTPADENSKEPPSLAIDIEGLLVIRQTRQQVLRVLGQLSEKDRQLLRAIFWEERDKDEVCREFGVDRDYLRVLLHRAKQNFRVFYQKQEGAGETAPGP